MIHRLRMVFYCVIIKDIYINKMCKYFSLKGIKSPTAKCYEIYFNQTFAKRNLYVTLQTIVQYLIKYKTNGVLPNPKIIYDNKYSVEF